MNSLIMIVILANPANVAAHLAGGDGDEQPACKRTQVLQAGKPAPCSGLLFAVDHARQALTCVRSELPQCQADRSLELAKAIAERDSLALQLEAFKQVAQTAEPPSVWPKVLTGISGVAVGVVIGALWSGGL
jgi:hypothetical protein